MDLAETLSPKQVGRALGLSEATIKRWCDNGLLPFAKTPGGHRRVRQADVVGYARDNAIQMKEPGVLGLPPAATLEGRGDEQLAEAMKLALSSGKEDEFLSSVMTLYLSGRSCAELFDDFLAPAFVDIGTEWEHGDLEVYEERRACEVCTRLLHELRRYQRVPDDAPFALGGTLTEDPYVLAPTMAEITLREVGIRGECYGVNLPAETLISAIRAEKPSLVWISASHMEDEERFVDEYARVFEAAAEESVRVALGGRAITEDVRQRVRFHAFCDRMQNLADFGGMLLE